MIRDIEHVTEVFRARSRGRGRHIFRYHCACGQQGMWMDMELYTLPERAMHEQAMARLAGPAAPIVWRRRSA